jgi:hypothetical protein
VDSQRHSFRDLAAFAKPAKPAKTMRRFSFAGFGGFAAKVLHQNVHRACSELFETQLTWPNFNQPVIQDLDGITAR